MRGMKTQNNFAPQQASSPMSEHQKPQGDILAAFHSAFKNCRATRDAQKLTDSSVEFVEPIDHVYELELCHQYQARRKASIDVVKRCEIIEAALPESGFNSLSSISEHVGIHRNRARGHPQKQC